MPQVLAATLPIGALSNQVGTVIKLVRVLMLGPVVLGLSVVAGRLRDQTEPAARSRDTSLKKSGPAVHELVPWFIVGFLVIATARSLDVVPQDWLRPIAVTVNILTTLAMAGLGLGVDVRVVARAGVRVAGAVTLSLIVLAIISVDLIRAVGIL